MDPAPGGIRTPDQRLRVFVSSTLKELAAERRAARRAIEQLHLAPVMFELGARPHPPRDLYRAYLRQSDIFVGLYGDQYGWVAPDEEISGLEDEYRLAPPELPKLMYVRRSDAREPRLAEMLAHMKDDDRTSYVYFDDAEELGDLLRTDLATLLAERFVHAASAAAAPDAAPRPVAPLPAARTPIIGRDDELARIAALVASDDVRLVTLTGPGGIGKTRLSIDAARAAEPGLPDGVVFVDLASATDAAGVESALATALGVRDAGDGTIGEQVRVALGDRRMLLVLDNLEQVADGAATVLSGLLAAARGTTVLATSRILLRIAGEQGVEVGPLALPAPDAGPDEAAGNPAVALFLERARATRPDVELTDANVASIVGICIALDGVPLAIELAAARARLLSPADLLERLDRSLVVLAGGARDLPERQRTMRSTIDWSTQLLTEPQRALFARLGVFAGPFSLEAAEWLVDDVPDAFVLDDLGALVDGSLVHQRERDDHAAFTMLATVREYAREALAAEPDDALGHARARHAAWYLRVADAAELELEGAAQLRWMLRLGDESENLRAAARYLLEVGRWGDVAELTWDLYVYWWVGGHLGEVRGWMQEVLDRAEALDDRTRAIALYFTRAIGFWQREPGDIAAGLDESARLFHAVGDPSGEALAQISRALALLGSPRPDPVRADAALTTSLELLRSVGDQWGVAMALVTLGRVAILQQRVQVALERFDESLAVARRQDDRLGEEIALHHLGWADLLLGDAVAAAERFAESLRLSVQWGHAEGVAYGLEGVLSVAATAGRIARAGVLLGASEVLRERTGLYNQPSFSFHSQIIDGVRESPAAALLEQSRLAGRAMPVDEAVALALDDRDPEPAGPGASEEAPS
ncbi:ATP-binding protein [Agromyces sp. SYSU T00194]|uniref:ATP-binding protein n=1 Tax=Agromyces chitinivorans TaxID=3158560 RepID=UPI00339B5A40